MHHLEIDVSPSFSSNKLNGMPPGGNYKRERDNKFPVGPYGPYPSLKMAKSAVLEHGLRSFRTIEKIKF